MLLAGYETSGHTLAFCLWHLALNPDIQTRLREEILDAYQGLLSNTFCKVDKQTCFYMDNYTYFVKLCCTGTILYH